jgi:hypothetical protein
MTNSHPHLHERSQSGPKLPATVTSERDALDLILRTKARPADVSRTGERPAMHALACKKAWRKPVNDCARSWRGDRTRFRKNVLRRWESHRKRLCSWLDKRPARSHPSVSIFTSVLCLKSASGWKDWLFFFVWTEHVLRLPGSSSCKWR